SVITFLGAHQGVRGVPRVYLDAADSLGASGWLRFKKVVLPAAFPSIFASVRIAAGLAWVTIVVAELIDARMPSLGYLLALSGAYPRGPTMLLGIATGGRRTGSADDADRDRHGGRVVPRLRSAGPDGSRQGDPLAGTGRMKANAAP